MTKSAKIFQQLDECPIQAQLVNSLQLLDIVDHVIAQIGPSRLRMTSFSISEEALRHLAMAKRNGSVTEVQLALDFKATNKTVSLWYFIEAVCDRADLCENHSKIVLLESASGRRVAIMTSQNLTRGNRNESYIIAEDPRIFDRLSADLDDIINNKSISLYDLLCRTAEDD